MASVLTLFKNGGQMVEDMDVLLTQVSEIAQENHTLKMIIEKQGAILVSLADEISTISQKIDEIQDTVNLNVKNTDEIKTTEYIGKVPKFLPTLMEEVERLDHREIRNLIRRATKNQKEEYVRLYTKLAEITGINVFKVGKHRITKRHGLGFTNSGESYINTLFIKGIEREAAAIALDIIRNK